MEQRLAAANVYAIVNGDLITSQTCGRRDRALCDTVGTDGRYGAHADWSLLNLAFRSERYSAATKFSGCRWGAYQPPIQEEGSALLPDLDLGGKPHPFLFDGSNLHLGAGHLTCTEWRAMDADLEHPIQFHPREMHCLIDYGRSEFDQYLNWHLPPPPPPPPSDVAAPAPKP